MFKKIFILVAILWGSLVYGMHTKIDVEKIRNLHIVATINDGTQNGLQIENTIENLSKKQKIALKSMLEKDSSLSEEQSLQIEIQEVEKDIPYCSTGTLEELEAVITKYVKCFLGNDNFTYDYYDQMIGFLSPIKSFEDFQKQLDIKVGLLLKHRSAMSFYARNSVAIQIFLWNEELHDVYKRDNIIDRVVWAKICTDLHMPRATEDLEKYLSIIKERLDKK